jgi:hypothetical protein
MKNVVFWDVALCRFCVNRRFGGSVGQRKIYTEPHSRRWHISQLLFFTNILTVIKFGRMKWPKNSARMELVKWEYNYLLENYKGKIKFGLTSWKIIFKWNRLWAYIHFMKVASLSSFGGFLCIRQWTLYLLLSNCQVLKENLSSRSLLLR